MDISEQPSAGETVAIRGLRVSLGTFELACSDLTLHRGVTLLAGPNGAGKTTLLRAMAGSLRPSSGTIRRNDAPLERRHVSLLPQNPTLPADLTSGEVVAYVLWLHGTSHRRATAEAREILASFALDDAVDKPVRTLSGGMARRLSIACSMASAPDVLLLDEPTNDLDPVQKASVLTMIEALGRDRVVVVSSHALNDLEKFAQHIALMNHGRVIAEGSMASLRATHGDGHDSSLEDVYLRAVTSDDRRI